MRASMTPGFGVSLRLPFVAEHAGDPFEEVGCRRALPVHDLVALHSERHQRRIGWLPSHRIDRVRRGLASSHHRADVARSSGQEIAVSHDVESRREAIASAHGRVRDR